jgi:lambda family phage portal protein
MKLEKKLDVQPNLIDRAINYVAPVWAAQRFRSRAIQALTGAYVGARIDRRSMASWFTTSGSADADTVYDLDKLRSRSRDLYRNNPIATGAVQTAMQNIVGSGLSLRPTPDVRTLGWNDDKTQKWIQSVSSEFELWASSPDCDLTRNQNFYQLQGMALLGILQSGDIVALLPMVKVPTLLYATRIQMVEADRLRNPPGAMDVENSIMGGVEIETATGAPIAYHIRRVHPGAANYTGSQESDRIEAFGKLTGRRNVVHPFVRERPGQTRGVPYLAPVIETLKQIDRYTEAEVMAAVISAMLTVFVTTEAAEGLQGVSDQTTGNVAPGSKGSDANNVQLGSGSIIDLRPGEEIQVAKSDRPNAGFDAFIQSIQRQIGMALSIPYEVLVKRFDASYSAARASLLEAWRFFRLRREFMAASFCNPIYEAWMDEAVALNRISAPGYFADPMLRRAYLSAHWVGDAQGSIDPMREAQAAEKRLQLEVSSLTQETLEMNGRDWKDVHRERKAELELQKADGTLAAQPNVAPKSETPDFGGGSTPPDQQPNKPAPAKPGN